MSYFVGRPAAQSAFKKGSLPSSQTPQQAPRGVTIVSMGNKRTIVPGQQRSNNSYGMINASPHMVNQPQFFHSSQQQYSQEDIFPLTPRSGGYSQSMFVPSSQSQNDIQYVVQASNLENSQQLDGFPQEVPKTSTEINTEEINDLLRKVAEKLEQDGKREDRIKEIESALDRIREDISAVLKSVETINKKLDDISAKSPTEVDALCTKVSARLDEQITEMKKTMDGLSKTLKDEMKSVKSANENKNMKSYKEITQTLAQLSDAHKSDSKKLFVALEHIKRSIADCEHNYGALKEAITTNAKNCTRLEQAILTSQVQSHVSQPIPTSANTESEIPTGWVRSSRVSIISAPTTAAVNHSVEEAPSPAPLSPVPTQPQPTEDGSSPIVFKRPYSQAAHSEDFFSTQESSPPTSQNSVMQNIQRRLIETIQKHLQPTTVVAASPLFAEDSLFAGDIDEAHFKEPATCSSEEIRSPYDPDPSDASQEGAAATTAPPSVCKSSNLTQRSRRPRKRIALPKAKQKNGNGGKASSKKPRKEQELGVNPSPSPVSAVAAATCSQKSLDTWFKIIETLSEEGTDDLIFTSS